MEIAMNMNLNEQLERKYSGYQDAGHSVFAVTLSTYMKDIESFAPKSAMEQFWKYHFIYRVQQRLPFNAREKIDYDYVVERSPHGHFHYHGWLALPAVYAPRVWRNGALHP